MSKISNIGTLDVREIQEDLASNITEMTNIGILLESEESQALLKNCKRENIGVNIKVPLDVKVVMQNGKVKLDRDYLEGFSNPIAIILNGKLTVGEDVDRSLIDEKIYSIIVNGKVICPNKLVGTIQSKGTINGKIVGYREGYMLIDDLVEITDQFLNSLESDSKLAVNRLMAIKDFDMELFKEKMSQIQVLSNIIVTEDNEKLLSKYIDDYYSLSKSLVPVGAKYIDDDLYIDDHSIKRFKDSTLYVDGEVEIYLEEDIELDKYIKSLTCENVICNDLILDEVIKILEDKDIEVEVIRGKLIKNNGNMVLSGELDDFDKEITIRNLGKLVLEKNLDYGRFSEKVALITNYGLILAPEDKLNIVKNKVKENLGGIKSLQEKKEVVEEEENILYSNMGELKL